jgi:ABC-type nitrate/sulfonate/bicarbonate transport system substrate-binding protein
MAEHDKLGRAVDDPTRRSEADASGLLTRRSFVAKAGLTAAGLAAAGTLPTIAASCGSSASSGSAAASPGAANKPATVVRFVFAPDPVWNYMQDTGIVAKYEAMYNFKIVNTTTWDETAWFVGGHADIASMGSYEVPLVTENTGKAFTSFGVYNLARDAVFVRSDSPYKDMTDLVGKRVSCSGGGGATILWAALFKEKYGLDFALGSGDFKVSAQEFTAMPAQLQKGDVEASIGLIDYELPYLVDGRHRFLYPDTPIESEFYATYMEPPGEKTRQCASNLWVTTPEWYNANKEVAQHFNVMWQEGVNAWWNDKAGIIQAYPDLFTVTNKAELDYFLNWLNTHDWTVYSVYIDSAWADREQAVIKMCRDAGVIKQSTPNPQFEIVTPPSDAPPEAQPPAGKGV